MEVNAPVGESPERHVGQRHRWVCGAERGCALGVEPGVGELLAQSQVVVAEDEDPLARAVPESGDQDLVVDGGRVSDVAQAHDRVRGPDGGVPGLEDCLLHRREVGERPAVGGERARVTEVEVGPDPRPGRGRVDDEDRAGLYQAREVVLGGGAAGDPRREGRALEGVLPQRGDGGGGDGRHPGNRPSRPNRWRSTWNAVTTTASGSPDSRATSAALGWRPVQSATSKATRRTA